MLSRHMLVNGFRWPNVLTINTVSNRASLVQHISKWASLWRPLTEGIPCVLFFWSEHYRISTKSTKRYESWLVCVKLQYLEFNTNNNRYRTVYIKIEIILCDTAMFWDRLYMCSNFGIVMQQL